MKKLSALHPRHFIPRLGIHSYAVHHAPQPLLMPALSPTMTEGAIVKWNIEQGTGFNAGDVLFQVETDKAQLEVDAQEDGILAKILVSAGSKGVAVNSVIAVLAEQGEDLASINLDQCMSAILHPVPYHPPILNDLPALQPVLSNTLSNTHKLTSASTTQTIPTLVPDQLKQPIRPRHHPTKKSNKPIHLSPAVARIMHEYKIDKSTVLGIKVTGPQQRILKSDMLAYIKNHNLKRPPLVVHPEPSSIVHNIHTKSPQSSIKTPIHLLNIGISCSQYCRPIDTRVAVQDALSQFVKTNNVQIVIDHSLHLGKSHKVLYLTMDGVHRRTRPTEPLVLPNSLIEGQFYAYLAGDQLSEHRSWSVPVRTSESVNQDVYEYLAGVPLLSDTRFQFVYRVSVMQVSGFANDSESESVVNQISSVVRAALAST